MPPQQNLALRMNRAGSAMPPPKWNSAVNPLKTLLCQMLVSQMSTTPLSHPQQSRKVGNITLPPPCKGDGKGEAGCPGS